MVLAAIRTFARFPRRRLSVCIDGEATLYRTPCLVIGVNEYSFEGFRVQRQAAQAGGALWLFVAKQRGALAFLRFALRAVVLGLGRAGEYDVVRARELEIRPHAHRLWVAHDGEVERLRGPLRYRLLPGALRVLAAGEPP